MHVTAGSTLRGFARRKVTSGSASNPCSRPPRRAIRRWRRRRARSSPRCARRRPGGAGSTPAASTGSRRTPCRISGSRPPPSTRHGMRSGPASGRRWPRRRRASATTIGGSGRRSWQYLDEDGTVLGQRITPLDSRRRLRARRQGELSVVGADEHDTGAGGRGRGDRDGRCPHRRERSARWCSPRPGWPASARCGPSAERRRSRPSLSGPGRSGPWTRSSGPGTATWPPPSGWCTGPWAST